MRRGRVDLGVGVDQFANVVHDALQLGGRGTVGEPEHLLDPARREAREIHDRLGRHQLVRDHDEGLVDETDLRRTQADVLDDAGAYADLHRLADLERLVDGDDDRTEEIGDGVLRREGEGQAADPEALHDRRDVVAETLHREQHAEDDEHGDERLLDPWHEGGDAHLLLGRNFMRMVEHGVEGAEHHPEKHERERHRRTVADRLVGRGGEL